MATASGVYLVVSNFDDPAVATTLLPTKGGYPHVTLLYAGSSTTYNLGDIAATVMRTISACNVLHDVVLSPDNVTLSSFTESSTQRERHDVLITLTVDDTAWINELRTQLCAGMQVTMREPHVTHSIHYDKDTAEAAAATLRAQLPLTVFVTGVTVE